MENSALQRALISGAASSIVSTVALALTGKKETGSAFGPTNAVSHYVHGNKASRRHGFSLRYTVPGYLIHHASATFWGFIFENTLGKTLDKKSPVTTLVAATATSAMAAFTDYQLTPKRLQPGYERKLSKKSLTVVYGGVALGLALGALLARKGEPPK